MRPASSYDHASVLNRDGDHPPLFQYPTFRLKPLLSLRPLGLSLSLLRVARRSRAGFPIMSCSKFWFVLRFLGIFWAVRAQGPAQTLFPAAIPLAVKTPYLNTWYQSVNGSSPLSNSWSVSWNMSVSLYSM